MAHNETLPGQRKSDKPHPAWQDPAGEPKMHHTSGANCPTCHAPVDDQGICNNGHDVTTGKQYGI